MIIEDTRAPDLEASPEVEPIETPRERDLTTVLRESLDDVKAGRVVPARQVLKEMAMRHGLPLEPGE